MQRLESRALCALAAILVGSAADGTTYNYKITAVAPTYGTGNPARDYGAVLPPAGTILSQGTFTTSDTLNDLSATLCYTTPCSAYGKTITSLTGSFRSGPTSSYEAITLLPNPIAPEYYGAGNFYGDYQLLQNQPTLLDEGGIVFSTPSLGYANLLAFRGISTTVRSTNFTIADAFPYQGGAARRWNISTSISQPRWRKIRP